MSAHQANVKHLKMQMKAGPSRKIRRTKAQGLGGKSYGMVQAGMEGLMGVSNATMTATGTSMSTTAGAVLSAAFGGTNEFMSMAGGGGMYGAGAYGLKDSLSLPGVDSTGVLGSSGTSVVPGTEGFTQWDMINSMNQNNLQLLELQAAMQSNLQSWNIRSNVINADHRAKMAMIEKLSPR